MIEEKKRRKRRNIGKKKKTDMAMMDGIVYNQTRNRNNLNCNTSNTINTTNSNPSLSNNSIKEMIQEFENTVHQRSHEKSNSIPSTGIIGSPPTTAQTQIQNDHDNQSNKSNKSLIRDCDTPRISIIRLNNDTDIQLDDEETGRVRISSIQLTKNGR